MRSIAFAAILLVATSGHAATEKKISEEKPAPVRPDLTVTMDVKDADVRDILKTMQRQCRIKNLAIDPEVQGKGTFFFEDVPCRTAFRIVFRSLGLDSINYPNVTTVGARPR